MECLQEEEKENEEEENTEFIFVLRRIGFITLFKNKKKQNLMLREEKTFIIPPDGYGWGSKRW